MARSVGCGPSEGGDEVYRAREIWAADEPRGVVWSRVASHNGRGRERNVLEGWMRTLMLRQPCPRVKKNVREGKIVAQGSIVLIFGNSRTIG